MKFALPLACLAFSALTSPAFAVDPDYYSPQNLYIGATPAVQSLLNNGAGVTVGVIDTGSTSSWVGFQGYQGNKSEGRVIGSICVSPCTSAALKSGNTDDNGHGTFVTSEIIGGIPAAGFTGIAPAANVIAVKVLNAQGSGVSTSLVTGIEGAANAGARVLNLSLGPVGTAAQEAAFYSSIAGAINYAASKNTVVVFAGGNSAQAFSGGANVTGYTDAALARMFFMGSTGASRLLSSFSNTPGTAGFTSTSGKFHAYDAMWMMADGENIIGASNYSTAQYGYGYITQMSGTSMAAPQGTGAAALLASRWPILLTNGTLSQLLEQTALDLGARGTDSVYGDGFLNVAATLQPIGPLSVKLANGQSLSLTSLTGSMVSGGALGPLANVQSLLSNYTVFDSYQRNFTSNLSGLIAKKPTVSAITQSVAAPKTTTGTTHFADGSQASFGSSDGDTGMLRSTNGSPADQNWFLSFSDAGGKTVAAGNGFPATASFDEAMWGAGSIGARDMGVARASDALASLAEGGAFVAYGLPTTTNTRLAVSWSETAPQDLLNVSTTAPNAQAFNVGFTGRITSGWQAGVTFGSLNEQNGLLGTTYSTGGPLTFGTNNRSQSAGFSSTIALGQKTDFLFDTSIARSEGASFSGSLLSDVTPLYARSMGVALAERDSFDDGDRLSLSINRPLRVFSGSASFSSAGVDAGGLPIFTRQRVGLAASGNELDMAVNYQAPVKDNVYWNMSVQGTQDPENTPGSFDVTGIVRMGISF